MTKDIETNDVAEEKKEASVKTEKKEAKPAAKKVDTAKEEKAATKKADAVKEEKVVEKKEEVAKEAPAKKAAAKKDDAEEAKAEKKEAPAKKAETKKDDATEEAKAVKKEAPAKKAETKKDETAEDEKAVDKKESGEKEFHARKPAPKKNEAGETETKSYERKPRAPYQKGERSFSRGGNFYRQGSRRRVCPFCANKVDEIDYIKLAAEINKGYDPHSKEDQRPRYITEKGRILPRRMSGVCVKHQRALATAVKRARIMGLLPFSAD